MKPCENEEFVWQIGKLYENINVHSDVSVSRRQATL